MGNLLYLSHVLKASPGVAIFGRDVLFDIPFLADWNKIGEYRQHQTDFTPSVIAKHVLIMISKWVTKY